MQARNKLVIVRDGDELLRIPLSKRVLVKLTQKASNTLVMNEIAAFVGTFLNVRTARMCVCVPVCVLCLFVISHSLSHTLQSSGAGAAAPASPNVCTLAAVSHAGPLSL